MGRSPRRRLPARWEETHRRLTDVAAAPHAHTQGRSRKAARRRCAQPRRAREPGRGPQRCRHPPSHLRPPWTATAATILTCCGVSIERWGRGRERKKKGAGWTCSGGTAPHRRCRPAPPRAARQEFAAQEGQVIDRNEVRVWGRRPASTFCPSEDRAQSSNGDQQLTMLGESSGFFRPRREAAFPAEAQVAAWTRGAHRACVRRRLGLGPVLPSKPLRRWAVLSCCAMGHGPCFSRPSHMNSTS